MIFYLDTEDAAETVAGSTLAVGGPVGVGAQGLVVGGAVQRDGGQGGGAAAPPPGKGDEHAVLPYLDTQRHLVLGHEGAGLDGGIARVRTRPVKINLITSYHQLLILN